MSEPEHIRTVISRVMAEIIARSQSRNAGAIRVQSAELPRQTNQQTASQTFVKTAEQTHD